MNSKCIKSIFEITSDHKVNIGKDAFGLHQLTGVSLMKKIVNSISIDSNRPTSWIKKKKILKLKKNSFIHFLKNLFEVFLIFLIFNLLMIILELNE